MKIMRIMALVASLTMLQGQIQSRGMYLWEMANESGRSCCLHFDGTDICNPDTPCTHYMQADMASILEYVSRILSTQQGAVEPHHTMLLQVQRYIRMALHDAGFTISYQLDRHKSVKFYHELLESAVKNKDKVSSSKAVPDKQKTKNDKIIEILTKMGLYHLHKK